MTSQAQGAEHPLELARAALRGERAWVVGGWLRDTGLGRQPARVDLDLVVDGDPEPAARRLRSAAGRGSAAFSLSDQYGAWRVVGPGAAWQVDIAPLHEDGLEADLCARDMTVNAIAEPLEGGEPIDPTGGVADLKAGVLRMVSPESFDRDPLRVVRVARLAAELGLRADPATIAQARARVGGLVRVSGERIFAELRALIGGPDPVAGLRLLEDTGAAEAVLPELTALRGIEQTAYHHLDAHDHTLEVLERVVALEADPRPVVGEERMNAVRALLDEPLADELTRGGALRWGALLHDIAKPVTMTPLDSGGFGFPGHDVAGAQMSQEILGRLRASVRLRNHVAALARNHLLLGFLVRQRPLSRRVVHDYLLRCGDACADVTLLSIADRLATRGRKAQESIENHMEVALPMLDDALAWHEHGPPAPLLRGDELAAELGIEPGPALGELLAEIAAAQYAGEVTTREQALELVRGRIG
jgi:tRNA nucleotidyltransferase/poly(A) polymerase